MNWGTAWTAITSYYSTNVEVGLSLPTQYDNGSMPVTTGAWARMTILSGTSAMAAFGSGGLHRNPGIVVIQIFDQLFKGDGAILTLADAIANLFRTKSVPPVQFRTPSIRNIGRSENLWQVNVELPFYHDYAA